jgi:dolichyl-phosphate beta-glucosyltransferase
MNKKVQAVNSEMSLASDEAMAREISLDSQPRVSVVIPAFNEEARIGSTISQWVGFLGEHYSRSYEILVVMDGCTDQTVDVVSKISNQSEGLIISYYFPRKLGKGGALIEAFRGARGKVLFFTDADCSVPTGELLKFVSTVEKDDVAIGCRYFKGSDFVDNLPLSRFIFSRGFNALLKIMFPALKHFHDTQCGAKAIQRHMLDTLGDDLFITDFAFDVNLIYAALRHNLSVREIRIKSNHYENESKISPKLLKISFAMFLSIVRLRLHYSRFKSLIHSSRLKPLIGLLMRVYHASPLV